MKAENFDGKRQFIKDHKGLEFLITNCSDLGQSIKLRKRIWSLIYDFVLNDEGIFEKEDPSLTRKFFSGYLDVIVMQLQASDINKQIESQLRDYLLKILFRIYQIDEPRLGPKLMPVLE